MFSPGTWARGDFSIGRVHDKMGERLANNAELVFQDCFIPDENVVGGVAKLPDTLRVFPAIQRLRWCQRTRCSRSLLFKG